MIELLTSPWFWVGVYYVVAGIAAVVLAARKNGQMTVGLAVACLLLGFTLTPLCLLFILYTVCGVTLRGVESGDWIVSVRRK